MRKVFYIFRHGETDYNKERRWQGCSLDGPLNATGLQQAKDLVLLLQGKGLQIIYSSPLQRALQTAETVACALALPLQVIANLHEGRAGVAEGLLREEVEQQYPEAFNAWYSDVDDMEISFEGGETKRQIQERMFDVISDLLRTPEKTIGIASHSGSIRYLLMKFGCLPHKMPNTALFCLTYDEGAWSVERLL